MFKGIDKIEQVLNAFLEPFECSVKLDTDFCYLYEDSVIGYALVTSEKNNNAFLANAKKLFPTITADIFLWSFLHELGHHETIEEITDKETEISMYVKNHLDDYPEAERNNIYFNLPDENAATTWAGEYMLDHTAEVAKLWKTLQPLLKNFYVLNNITD